LIQQKDSDFEIPEELDPPIVRTGDSYSLKDKFTYIPPHKIIEEFAKVGQKHGGLKRYVDALVSN